MCLSNMACWRAPDKPTSQQHSSVFSPFYLCFSSLTPGSKKRERKQSIKAWGKQPSREEKQTCFAKAVIWLLFGDVSVCDGINQARLKGTFFSSFGNNSTRRYFSLNGKKWGPNQCFMSTLKYVFVFNKLSPQPVVCINYICKFLLTLTLLFGRYRFFRGSLLFQIVCANF